MVKDLGQLAGSELTKRQFLKGAVAAAVVTVGIPTALTVSSLGTGGCATFNRPISDSDFFSGSEVDILFDYESHGYHERTNPKGIDFTAGFGKLLAAPTVGDVWYSDTIKEGTLVKIETPFGHMIELSCESELLVKINDKVTPWNFIGREGMECGKGGIGVGRADTPHVHIHIFDPPFAPEHKKSSHIPFIVENGVTNFLVNPNSYRAYGNHISESIFAGDTSQIERLIAVAQSKFYGLADRHPNSHLAWFLRESNKDPNIRFFPKVMVAYNMLKNGFLETQSLKEEVEAYLRWHSNLTGFLYAPYANSRLMAQYRQHQPKLFEGIPNIDYRVEIEKAHAHWLVVDDKMRNRKYKESISALGRHRKLSPIYGEAQIEINLGIALGQVGSSEKALVHLLIGDGMLGYKFGSRKPESLNHNLYWTFRNLEFVYKRLSMPDKAEVYKAKYITLNLIK